MNCVTRCVTGFNNVKRDVECLVSGHELRCVQQFSLVSWRSVCAHCGRSYCVIDMYGARSVLEWDKEAHDAYARAGVVMEYLHVEKRLKLPTSCK